MEDFAGEEGQEGEEDMQNEEEDEAEDEEQGEEASYEEEGAPYYCTQPLHWLLVFWGCQRCLLRQELSVLELCLH